MADLVGSANFNVTDADVTDEDDEEAAPGNALDPEDFAKAMTESYDPPLLDEVLKSKSVSTLLVHIRISCFKLRSAAV